MKTPKYLQHRLFCICMLYAAIAITSTVKAQPFDALLAYRSHYHFPSEYKIDAEATGDKFRLFQQTLDVNLPVPFNTAGGKALVIGGLFYNHFTFESVTDGEIIVDEKANRWTFKAGLSYPWNGKHRSNVIFLPTWSSTTKAFTSDAFQYGFLAVHSIKFSDRFTLKGGLYFNREFYGNFFMPLVGVDWRLNNDWYIFGLLPGTFNVYKKVNDWFGFSLSERAPNGSVNDPVIPGGFLAYGRGAYALFMFDLHFSPFSFDLLGNDSDLTFSVSLGHSMFREYLLFKCFEIFFS